MMYDSATPKQTMKRFTIREAEAMLPLVRSIVGDICEIFRNVTGRRSDLHRLLRKRARCVDQVYADEVAESRADLQEEYDRIWQYREELESLGVFLRQPEEGFIEFPTMIHGQEAFLVWQLGDEKVSAYRPADAPSSTRLKLPSTEL